MAYLSTISLKVTAAASTAALLTLAWHSLDIFQEHSFMQQAPVRRLGADSFAAFGQRSEALPRNLSLSNVSLSNFLAGVKTCPGSISVGGLGNSEVVAAQWNQPGKPAGPVEVQGGRIMPHMWGRAYLASSCSSGSYSNAAYHGVKLLGKKLKYTTDISQAGCGCNAAMYLVPMHKNTEATSCKDHYCDASWVCGASCAEIDVQEANKHAWHSALHKEYDMSGVAVGYGGWTQGGSKYAFDSEKFGPGAKCIDTSSPFHVTASFPEDGGRLVSMDVTLSQGGCSLEMSHQEYPADPGFAQISKALSEGMTPVVSYWKASDMLWLDGPGMGEGPCKSDSQNCGSAVQFYGFSVE
eukprot:TRINITY_DN18397_c0_g1_i1.p1 TRINITY_DN18397_c0_g1~~TRINITY_DN18397_c0_g1_i1.p1  ORF type:complete len:353 (+),score=69.30 TRINITY_DN18397_c0_g1_i1:58-1116(+)